MTQILKRKNPQLEESILPDSEEEDFGSGRCNGGCSDELLVMSSFSLASVLNGIIGMRASE